METLSLKQPLRAVLLDVDGTLYDQRYLRLLMIMELWALPLSSYSLRSAYNTWQAIRHFRRVREELRTWGQPAGCLARLQYIEAAKQSGIDLTTMESSVSEWLYERPLKYLRRCRFPGIPAFLSFLTSANLRVGVFSDYPAADKLEALDLIDAIPLVLCATDPEINALKPHPNGLLRACSLWGVSPDEVLYVGDRPEVDAVAAAAAGMPCVIITRSGRRTNPQSRHSHYAILHSFAELEQALANS